MYARLTKKLVCGFLVAFFGLNVAWGEPPSLFGSSEDLPHDEWGDVVSPDGEGADKTPTATKSAATSTSRRLVPGYVLSITVFVAGDKEIEDPDKRIQDDGTITLPLLGAIKVAGMTLADLREHLTALYNKSYFVDPQVVVDFSSAPGSDGVAPWGYVTVLGRVKKPGRVNIPATGDLKLTGAIQQAGGFDTSAKDTAIRVTRTGKSGKTEQKEINLRTIGSKGKADDDITLKPGDIIFVPELIF